MKSRLSLNTSRTLILIGKILSWASFIFTFYFLSVFASNLYKSSPFDGTWQLTKANYPIGSVGPNEVYLKIFQQGRFESYMIIPQRSAPTMAGKFKVLNDSVYTEFIISARNKPMTYKTYEISYSKNGDVMETKGFFDAMDPSGRVVKRQYAETWTRISRMQPRMF